MVTADRDHLIHCRSIHSPKGMAGSTSVDSSPYVCLHVLSQLHLNSSFLFLICLSFIKSNLEALYRGCKPQSQRHTIQKSCHYCGNSFQQKSLALPVSFQVAKGNRVSETKLTSAGRWGKNPGNGLSEKHGAVPGREKRSQPKLMLAMESACLTRTH